MPLFGRRLFHLNDIHLKDDNNEIYTIEHTGEIFYNKILYEKLSKAYELERWTCQCTWKAGLTHKQAYESEIEIRKTLSLIVPNYFNKPIFDIIYHSKNFLTFFVLFFFFIQTFNLRKMNRLKKY